MPAAHERRLLPDDGDLDLGRVSRADPDDLQLRPEPVRKATLFDILFHLVLHAIPYSTCDQAYHIQGSVKERRHIEPGKCRGKYAIDANLVVGNKHWQSDRTSITRSRPSKGNACLSEARESEEASQKSLPYQLDFLSSVVPGKLLLQLWSAICVSHIICRAV